MSGNVEEWCFDFIASKRMIRGGNWGDMAGLLMVGLVGAIYPDSASTITGFRLARSR